MWMRGAACRPRLARTPHLLPARGCSPSLTHNIITAPLPGLPAMLRLPACLPAWCPCLMPLICPIPAPSCPQVRLQLHLPLQFAAMGVAYWNLPHMCSEVRAGWRESTWKQSRSLLLPVHCCGQGVGLQRPATHCGKPYRLSNCARGLGERLSQHS